ncbi:hypothetical protein RN001_014040 [Aquatica leii]|uniref:Uncharacterized protein n=1 Tax=Aquatica leii TaxID=1421715 RepID=A0AAN7SNY4_9COLE|nr:hypothetical protein RN001_014040 [Aquatica leii]
MSIQVFVSLLLVASVYCIPESSPATDIIQELSFKIKASSVSFPCDSTRNIYLSTGRYIQKNLLVTRFQMLGGTMICAIPRLRPGVPITLASFSLKSKDGRPMLEPYPCWSIQEEGNPDALQNVVDISLDRSETLWVLDNGVCNALEQPIKRSSPKIVGINTKTGQIVKSIDLSKFVTGDSKLQYIAVDVDDNGNYFAYVSDAGSGAIIVYDIFNDKGYRVVLPRIISASATNNDALYIVLVHKSSGNLLYFKYLSSRRVYYIKTSYLQKGQVSGAVVDVGPTPMCDQIVLLGSDNGAAIFFRCRGSSDIYIWNTQTCLKEDNFLLVQKGEDCRLPAQVVPGYKRLMWVLESNVHDYINNTVGCLGASMIQNTNMKLLALFLVALATKTTAQNLETIAQWNVMDFNFPHSDYGFISNFKPERTVVTGLEVSHDRVFVSMPRLYSGVPATVGFIPKNIAPGSSPKVHAFPNWDFHEVGRGVNSSCDGLTSVYRLKLDSCGRLWVLDSGIMTSLEDFRRICPPKIVIFDLNTDLVARTIIFPREVLRPSTLLTNLVIDESVQGTCDSAFVYITDTVAPGMIVYDSLTERAWRVMHPSMFPDPDFSDSTINDETFTLMDGVVGLTHSPNLGVLYYQPLATNRIFSVPTAALRKGPPAELETLPVSLVGTKSSQGIALVVDPRDDTLYFSPLTETSIGTWNPHNNNQRLVSYDQERLQFVADMRWNPEDGNLWIVSTRFQKFFRRSLNTNDFNIRVLRISTSPSTIGNNNVFFKK